MTNSYYTPARDELQQGRNFEDFVHVHPSEFVLTAARKGICIIIATRILRALRLLVEAVPFYR